jgi:hypothetical protein
MNRENVKKWVKALRSGKYKQGRGALLIKEGNSEKYCCLGVVCKLAGMKPKEKNGRFYFGNTVSYLPKKAQKWLWVGREDPLINDILATTLNDARRLTFKQIANRIEKYLLN